MDVGPKPKIEVPTYSGSLNGEDLIDWINGVDKYFEYEGVAKDRRVKFACTRLFGHTAMWWDFVQSERGKKNKEKINSRDQMAVKLKAKFLPRDYQANPFKRLQNLKQNKKT